MRNNSPYRRKPSPPAISLGIIAFIVFFVFCLVFGAWVTFIAPCNKIGWVPVKELPSRCLTFVKDH